MASRASSEASSAARQTKRGRGRPRKNKHLMPVGGNSTLVSVTSKPVGEDKVSTDTANTPLGGDGAPPGTKATPLPHQATLQKPQGSARVQQPLETFGFVPSPARPTAQNTFSSSEDPTHQEVTIMSTFAPVGSGRTSAADLSAYMPPSSVLSEAEIAEQLRQKGLLELFEQRKQPGEDLRSVVKRMNAKSGIPLKLFHKSTIPITAPSLLADPIARAPTVEARFVPISPIRAAAPAPRKRERSPSSEAGPEPKRARMIVPIIKAVATTSATTAPAASGSPPVAAESLLFSSTEAISIPPAGPDAAESILFSYTEANSIPPAATPSTPKGTSLNNWGGLRQEGPIARFHPVAGLPNRTPTPESRVERESAGEDSAGEEEDSCVSSSGGKGKNFEVLLRNTPRRVLMTSNDQERDSGEEGDDEQGGEGADEEDDGEDEEEDYVEDENREGEDEAEDSDEKPVLMERSISLVCTVGLDATCFLLLLIFSISLRRSSLEFGRYPSTPSAIGR
ncbi:hypothetical protein B0T16DRAFT_415586 [Cercophora newfieldiana]|uniref:Uncharacterized protein n=1 Tax=Cercophora newfieldiana TaxID=92897 RepID=A0AA39XZN8_9PEZI|nr:hypothetical protein B0T16DRAFT_415586 [Cercophora newfieldiana]